jgi:hypothetical protein
MEVTAVLVQHPVSLALSSTTQVVAEALPEMVALVALEVAV